MSYFIIFVKLYLQNKQTNFRHLWYRIDIFILFQVFGIPIELWIFLPCRTLKSFKNYKVIWIFLRPLYLLTPTEETWKRAEIGFREIWNFPIDGKHVQIKCPANSGSNYFCYRQFSPLVLLSIVDPLYKYLVVDVGSYGRLSDHGICEKSSFYSEFLFGKTILPAKPLPAHQRVGWWWRVWIIHIYNAPISQKWLK